MSFMFEVCYRPPADAPREAALTRQIAALGGRLDFREEPNGQALGGVCLTYEFDDLESARVAAQKLREQGEYVEGPVDYGP
jgi:hypothetical protein